ncbi:MAG: GntR family transcriptional regulator [Alcaligenaceae bacterium]|nr:GntR family transcriptional regulator [Alcaligenaceae bacterium]
MNSDRFEAFGSGPRYAQLAKTLFNEIDSKQYSIGDLLPTEYELCAQFGVSRSTAREAVKQLVQQGLVVRQPGVGSRVVAQAALLDASEGETWLHIQALRSVEGQALPICLTDVYVAPRFRSLAGASGRLSQPLISHS